MRNFWAVTGLALLPVAAAAEVLDDARAAYVAAWEAAPLSVGKAVFATAPADVYGLVEERSSNVFTVDEPIYIYVEPLGYGWLPNGAENVFGLDIGLKILTSAGQELFMNPDFLELTARSHARPTEFYGNITLNLAGIGPGEYVLELLLGDVASDETATASMPIVVE